MSQLDFTRDDFAGSRPAGARSVDDTSAAPEPVESEGARKVEALAAEVSEGAKGIGPSTPADLDENSREKASGIADDRDLAEERVRLAGGGRDPKVNAGRSSRPTDAEFEDADVDVDGAEKQRGRASTKAKAAAKTEEKAPEKSDAKSDEDASAE